MKSIDEIIKERKKIAKKNIYYLNEKDEVVTKENAIKVVITEYDANDNVINEVIGRIEEEKNIEEEGR